MVPKPWAGTWVHISEVNPSGGVLGGNVGLNVGDDTARVHRNRRDLADVVGRSIVWMDQTHSTQVRVIGSNEGAPVYVDTHSPVGAVAASEWGPVDADGVVLDARGWPNAPALAVQTADCLPIVFSAGRGRVLAAVHAGRRGLLAGILGEALRAIRSLEGGPIAAFIGPAICSRCYEVPAQMATSSEAIMEGIEARTSWGSYSLDLVGAAASLLAAHGVRVEMDGRCTRETGEFFSYRADPSCGRQALIIAPA